MKPSIKKILRNMLFLLSIPVIIGAFVFAQQTSQTETVKGVNIKMENAELSFVAEEDIMEVLTNQGIVPNQIKVGDINIEKVEQVIEDNKWVSKAEIYVSANQNLNIQVTQREPVLRVQQKDSSSTAYYLDAFANPINISERYTANVPVVTANQLGFSKLDLNFKSELVKLANYIHQDTFWNAVVSQIDIDDKHQITLIPAIGNQTILIGSIDSLDNKMKRLMAFYVQGVNTIDWTLYDEIDARYQGQIVCRNGKGLILAEDPYESKEDARQRVQVKQQIEKQEIQKAKDIERKEKEIAKAKELKILQAAKQKALEEKQAAKLKAQQEKQAAKAKK